MKQGIWKSALWVCLALGLSVDLGKGQTRVHLSSQGKAADFGSFPNGVRPWRAGTEMPESCQEGEAYFRTDLPAGHNLFVCVAGNTWKATSYDPGSGILVAGNTIQVEDAVIPTYRTGHGAATGSCSPGRDFYVDLDNGDLYFCASENTWNNLKRGPHTHTASEVTSGVLPLLRGGTGTATAESHSVLVGNGAAWTKAVLPQCADGLTQKLLYDQATQTFTCGADQMGSSSGSTGTTTTEAFWLFAGSSNNSTSYPNTWIMPSTGGATVNRVGTAPHQWSVLLFNDAVEQRATTTIGLHPLYQSGLKMTLYWYAGATTTGTVKWGVQAECIGETMPPVTSELPAIVQVAAHNGVNQGLNRTTIDLAPASCGPGGLLQLRLLRDGAHDGDTLTANAAVYGVQIRYVRGL
jgi:hypothetical protein